ncbi:MAG: class E sortase [Ilumatobacter sp.]
MSEIETPPSQGPAANPSTDPVGAFPAAPTPQARAVTPDADGTVRLGSAKAASSSTLTRRGRVRKWDRQPPPHDWRWGVGNVGKVLIAVGLLMFAFVGYQLYGTGIETAAAQSELEDEFEQALAEFDTAPAFEEVDTGEPLAADVAATDTDDISDIDSATEPVTDTAGDAPAADTPTFTPTDDVAAEVEVVPAAAQIIPNDLENGDAIARIEIPRIGVNDIVVAGVETGDLKRGPGHFPDTPLPGQLGNAAIAGHRTTYGQPFRNVDQLQVGDEIRMTTLNGVFIYRVTGQAIVEPSEYQVVSTTDPNVANLTLTSCHPVFTARQRIVIFSELDRTESAPVGEPVLNYGRPEIVTASVEPTPEIPGDPDLPAGDDELIAEPAEASGDTEQAGDGTPVATGDATGSLTDAPSDVELLGTESVNEGIADAFSESWFSDPGANPQVGLWGAVLAAIALAAYAISRRLRRDWAGFAIGVLPFVLALYFFFQNVNRLLPPNL